MNKRILSIYHKTLPESQEKIMMMLFEGGILGSFKINIPSDEVLSALMIFEDEGFLELILFFVMVISASIIMIIKRRRL